MIDVEAVHRPVPLFSGVAERLRQHGWIAAWWLGGRGLVLSAAVAIHAFGPTGYLRQVERAHALGALAGWDGRWYSIVASDGYLLVPGRQSDPAFFPLFPLLLRGGHALGLAYATAGIVIANVAFLAALVGFHALTRDLLGGRLARRATVYLAIFPFGYAFSMVYPESVVLAAITFAAVAAMRGRWAVAAACGAAASLARPEGVFVALPLAALAWQQRRPLTRGGRGLAFGAVLAPVAALASFPLYLDRVLHDPMAWSRAEQAWGRRFSALGIVHAFTYLGNAFAGNAWVVRDVIAAALYLALIVAAARAGAPRTWLVAGLAIVALPICSGSFASVGRFGLLAPPLFWGLAWIGRSHRADLAIRTSSLVLLAAATATVPLVFP